MSAKPIVDGIERSYAGQLLVLRVDVQDAAGRTLAQEYAVFATPTFLMFDGGGVEVWRGVGVIDPDQVAALLSSP